MIVILNPPTENTHPARTAHLLPLLKHPEERCHGTDVQGVGGDCHDVVQKSRQLTEENW